MAESNAVAASRNERKKFEKVTPEKSVGKISHQTDVVVTPPTTVIVRATRKKWAGGGQLSDRNNQENPSFSDSDLLNDYYEDLLSSDAIL